MCQEYQEMRGTSKSEYTLSMLRARLPRLKGIASSLADVESGQLGRWLSTPPALWRPKAHSVVLGDFGQEDGEEGPDEGSWPVVLWRPAERIRAPHDLLDRFLQLGTDPTPEAIAGFVRRWGGIRLCAHELPEGHDLFLTEGDFTATGPRRPRRKTASPGPGAANELSRCASPWPGNESAASNAKYVEPISVWARYLRQAHAILSLAEQLSDDRAGRGHNWEALLEAWLPESTLSPPRYPDRVRMRIQSHGTLPAGSRRSLEEEWWLLLRVVDLWLKYGSVGVGLGLNKAQGAVTPAAYIGSANLIGNLAAQMVWAVMRQDPLIFCSACGKPYNPERRPRAGEAHFCSDCREQGRPVEFAKKRYVRRRAIAALRQEGKTTEKIAEQFKVDVLTVERWERNKRNETSGDT
jgi:hypothetical protein